MENISMTKRGQQALGTGALTLDLVIGTDTPNYEGDFILGSVMLAAASAISQAIAVTIIRAAGAAYTFVIDSTTTSSATSYTFVPAGRHTLKRGDTVRLTCANSGTPAITVSGEIVVQPKS